MRRAAQVVHPPAQSGHVHHIPILRQLHRVLRAAVDGAPLIDAGETAGETAPPRRSPVPNGEVILRHLIRADVHTLVRRANVPLEVLRQQAEEGAVAGVELRTVLIQPQIPIDQIHKRRCAVQVVRPAERPVPPAVVVDVVVVRHP